MSERDRAGGIDDELLLGVDIGGTKILAGLVDRSGHVVERQRRPTRPDHILIDTIETCRDLMAGAARGARKVAGIGVGAKGAVDSRRRLLVGSLYLGHGEIPIGDHLERAFGLPVRVENDVHAAAISELVFGIGREVDDFVFYNAGTGIALGIIVDRQLYRGASNTAGENGHAVIDHSGRFPCPCGMTGCIETMIVAGRHGAGLPPILGWPVQPTSDDPAYAYLASNILDVVNIFQPAAVVLGGGMLTSANPAMTLPAELLARATHSVRDEHRCRIVPAFAGTDAGLVGASALMSQPADWLPGTQLNRAE